MTKPCDLPAVTARRLIGAKRLSPVELLDSCLERIAETNSTFNSIVAIDEKAARKSAKQAENQVMRGDELGILHGLPLGVKDLQATAGLRTTWGSLLYKDHVPKDDETGIAQLRNEGAIILAKTNTPEFGAGANTRNRVYGPTGNPFDPLKTCAGSSGGSAVALALGQVPLATGSDYAGSLRTPASFCGVVGFRPSPGLVPAPERAVGLSPFQVNGPMGRSVADAHLLLRAQLAIDNRDPWSSDNAMRLPGHLVDIDLGGVRAAISTDLGCAPVDEGIARLFRERVKTFSGAFAEVQYATPDFTGVHEAFDAYRAMNFVGAHAERLARHRDLLDRNVIDGTERGLAVSMAEFAAAAVQQAQLYKRFLAFFDEIDVLITPAAAVSPFAHAEWFPQEINGETMPNYTRWMTLAYAPTMVMAAAAVIPCGLDETGLPFGIQICGPHGSDAMVLEIAHALEQILTDNPVTRRPIPIVAQA